MFFNLDADVKNIMDSGRSKQTASITARVTFQGHIKPWYGSELVNQKYLHFMINMLQYLLMIVPKKPAKTL